MTNIQLSLLLAMGSAFCFCSASLVFAHFAQKISSAWMNTFKASVCLISLFITLFFISDWTLPVLQTRYALLASGALGLGIGDLFLLAAFARIGASRTLMLFAFQPLIIGFGASFFFGQQISALQVLAIFCLIICLFLMSLEKYKQEGRWETVGLSLALAGVLFDNAGVLISRWSFEHSPDLNPFVANVFRVLGALAVYAVFHFFQPIKLIYHFKELTLKNKFYISFAAFAGTFASLSMYIYALKIGHLPSLSALVLAGPLISALLESLVYKKPPSRYFLFALVFMVLGLCLFLKS
jgi:drug/metabolite transporter (DMT)-like permease